MEVARKKVKKLKEVMAAVKKAKSRNLKIVTTNGCFDLIHVGHVRNLEFAKSQGDILVVGVNSDKSVKSFKGKNRPIVPERERAEVIAALKPVDYVFIFKEKTPVAWLEKIRPDVHIKGGDRKPEEIAELKILKKMGAKFVALPLVKNKSTTRLIEKIATKNKPKIR